MFVIGAHLSKREGYLSMAMEADGLGANTFQYFSRNPRGSSVKPVDEADVKAYREYAEEHDIVSPLAYAPYDIEPASGKVEQRDFALAVMAEDMARLGEIPGQNYLVRPGSALDEPKMQGLAKFAAAINATVHPSQQGKLLICMLAGEGHQLCSSFEEVAQVIDQVDLKDHVGVLIDAAALWGAGYDIVDDLDGVLDEFDRVIGLDKLCAVHLNDSKEARGSHVDRHARIGSGTIGFDALAAMTNNPRLANLPFYIEEPHSTLAEYREDIERFKLARKA